MTDSNKKLPSFDDLVDVHRMAPQKVLQVLQVDADTGLSNAEVAKRQEFYGKNEFPPEKGTPLWLMILKQFSDALVLILIGAALISFVLAFFEEGEEASTAFVEPLVIVFILIVNATVGVLQESGAEEAVEALKKFDPEKATVIRGGQAAEIQAEELVPGDIVEVSVGDQIPADIRVIALHASAVDAEQALLTGESVPVEKITEALDKPDALVQDKRNMMFSGTTVSRGKARGIVTGTGLRTEKGKIRDRLAAKQESSFPLKERLDKFGQNLSVSIGVICAVVWLINIPHFSDPALGGWLKGAIFYFKVAVSLAVAAIPEGLPAVITTCLALGTQRMAKRGAIVTALPAVETLGCTNVICSDKTGTLTTNQMSVLQFFVVGDNKKSKEIVEFKVEGTTYSPFDDKGLLCNVSSMGDYSSVNLKKNQRVDVPATLPTVERLARICALNNDSSVVKKEDGTYDKLGQPTEASLKVLVEKLLLSDAKQIAQAKSQKDLPCPVNNHWEKSHQKLAVLEFNRQRKSMSVLVKDNTGAKTLLVKGAWDAVLSRCTNVNLNGQVVALDERLRKDLEKKIIDYCEGENNFRCLVLAERENIKDEAAFTKAKAEDFEKLESGLTFVGVVAILDPPRPEVRESIEKCKTAGIRVIVITGDNKATAVSICKKIGVFEADEDTTDKAFTGAEWKKLTEEQKHDAVKKAKLFARVEPIDKQDLVKYLHKHNMVAAMTGDGVNDAPALAEADIGIAMGTGTAVAKGAAKMVLANDNFATIVAAVEEGRNIYNNTKQFIRYLICSNIGEVVSIFTTAVLGLPEVLLPVQLLWVNLVTDGLPAVALGFNKPEEGIMTQKPRPRDEPIVTRWTLIRYLVVGTYIGLATVAGMVWWYMFYEQGPKLAWEDLFLWSKCQANTVSHGRNIDCAIFHDNNPNTVALSVLVTIEMFQALNSLSENSSLLSRRSHPFSNPHLLGAMALSFGLHFLILYVPMFAKLFSVAPLNWVEWQAVIMLSAPVILVDEFLKLISRTFLVDKAKPKSD